MSKEKTEGMEQVTGTCRYCGQAIMLDEAIGGVPEEERDAYATEKCNCAQAAEMRRRKKKIDKALKNIEELFGKERPEMEKILACAIQYVEADRIAKVTVDNGLGTKGMISKTSKGALKVEMAVTGKRAMEA